MELANGTASSGQPASPTIADDPGSPNALLLPSTPRLPLRLCDWTEEHIGRWLTSTPLPSEVADRLRENAINGPVLESLTDNDLIAMGIDKFGWRRQLLLSRQELVDQLDAKLRPPEWAECFEMASRAPSPAQSPRQATRPVNGTSTPMVARPFTIPPPSPGINRYRTVVTGHTVVMPPRTVTVGPPPAVSSHRWIVAPGVVAPPFHVMDGTSSVGGPYPLPSMMMRSPTYPMPPPMFARAGSTRQMTCPVRSPSPTPVVEGRKDSGSEGAELGTEPVVAVPPLLGARNGRAAFAFRSTSPGFKSPGPVVSRPTAATHSIIHGKVTTTPRPIWGHRVK